MDMSLGAHTNTTKIPSIITQFWIGPNPVSDFYLQCRESVIENHPGWDIRFVLNNSIINNEEVVEFFGDVNKWWDDMVNAEKCWAIRCDMLKFLHLWLYGGFAIDLDMWCLRSLCPLRGDDLVLGYVEKDGQLLVSEALIGARERDNRVEFIIRNFLNMSPYDGIITCNLSGLASILKWAVYPTEYFVPHPRPQHTSKVIIDKYFRSSNTYFIHCWNSVVYDVELLRGIIGPGQM